MPYPILPLDSTTSTAHTKPPVSDEGMVAKQTIIRQEVWDAVYNGLLGVHSPEDAHALASQIADAFWKERAAKYGQPTVPDDTRAAIAADLTKGGLSYAKLRDKYGVGISTIQRVADELRARGTTVRTSGQTAPGKILA